MKTEKIINDLWRFAENLPRVTNKRVKVVAAIVYKRKVVSIGFNQDKTHPMATKFQKNPLSNTLHAEVDAINKAKKILSKEQFEQATIVVARVKMNIKREEILGLSKPCKGCSECIEAHKIRKVVYTMNCNSPSEMKYITEVRNEI